MHAPDRLNAARLNPLALRGRRPVMLTLYAKIIGQKLVNEIYNIDEFVISKYNTDDELERYLTLQDSIEELREWFQFFDTDELNQTNKKWLEVNQFNWDKGTEHCFKITQNGKTRQLGEIRINHINYSHKFANITFWIRSGEEGKGIITRVVRKVIDICFSDLQLNRVELYMSINNLASKRIAEKVGAKLEGVMRNRIVRKGKIEDAYLYSVIKDDIKITTK